jgi:glycogen debranching enzyme
MAQLWAFTGTPPALETQPSMVTLVDGATFCISTSTGNVVSGSAMGLFVHDARVLSSWELAINGSPLEPLAVDSSDAISATFIGRTRPGPGQPESTTLVTRLREVGDGMAEMIRIRNLSPEAVELAVELTMATDFADLFEVKEGHVRTPDPGTAEVIDGTILLHHDHNGHSRGTRVTSSLNGGPPPQLAPGRMTWHLHVPPRAEWSCEVLVEALVDEIPVASFAEIEEGERAAIRRLRDWRIGAPVVSTPHEGLSRTIARSLEDLGALRMVDPRNPERTGVAAGAPWFMATFGRDSLLTSWMVLPIDLRLALGTLQTLADTQGERVDPYSEEQPGRIIHERRLGPASSLPLGNRGTYYGSADSTPLFVMLLGELRRWGQASADVEALLPNADRALDWIAEYGDRDGDGFVEYQRSSDRGLPNQGWKDSVDAITFADGTFAEPPIALAEVQGYVYAAYLARAHFAVESGDPDLGREWTQRARELKRAFNEQFWLEDRGYYALALDRDKRPVDSLASNMGHCLWTGIVDEDKAQSVVDHLMSPEMFSGWGIRTLASSMAAYNPMSYHNGSVWPHDNAIIAAGLSRYCFTAEAERVATGILDAAALLGGRLPELFCGMRRDEFARPVPYPTACAPQAWAAGSPFLLLRTLLRMEPRIPFGEVHLDPFLPPSYLPLTVSNLSLAGRRVSVDVTADGFSMDGLDPAITLVPEPRLVGTTLSC